MIHLYTCMAFMAPGIALYVCLKHLQRFVWHFLGPLQLHFVNPCPSDADCAVTADRKDTDVSRLTSSSVGRQVLGTKIKLISKEHAIEDRSLNGNLVDVCFHIRGGDHAKNVPWISSAVIN